MTAAWMIVSVLLGVVIVLGAVALDGVCRALRASTRWTWVGALTLIVLLTILVPLRRGRDSGVSSMPVTIVMTSASGRAAAAPRTLSWVMSAARAAIDAPLTHLTSTAVRAMPPALDRALLVVWAACSALLLGLGTVVFSRLLRAHRTWPVEVLHGERVHVSPNAGPAVLGFARGAIVVPRWLAECTADVQEVVVAHEREHVRARDPILLTLGVVSVILLPWNPATWWMLARLRLAVELDCDRRVLAGGVRTRDYGTLLIDLAGRTAGLPVGAPLVGLTMLAERTTHLERRIVAMSAPRPRHVAARIAAGTLVALVAALAACESHLPTEVEMNDMTAASAERAAAKVGLVGPSDSLTSYYIDGYAAGAEAARALSPQRIAAVRVVRDSMKTGAGSVWITTRSGDSLKFRSENAKTPAGDVGPVEHVTVHARTMQHFAGVIIVDGKRIAPSELNTVSRSDIKSIEVIKGDRAAALYPNDPAAAQGVIQITTKHGAP